jgi:hypothetical protein
MDPTDAAQCRSVPSREDEERDIEARFDHSYSVFTGACWTDECSADLIGVL